MEVYPILKISVLTNLSDVNYKINIYATIIESLHYVG